MKNLYLVNNSEDSQKRCLRMLHLSGSTLFVKINTIFMDKIMEKKITKVLTCDLKIYKGPSKTLLYQSLFHHSVWLFLWES